MKIGKEKFDVLRGSKDSSTLKEPQKNEWLWFIWVINIHFLNLNDADHLIPSNIGQKLFFSSDLYLLKILASDLGFGDRDCDLPFCFSD